MPIPIGIIIRTSDPRKTCRPGSVAVVDHCRFKIIRIPGHELIAAIEGCGGSGKLGKDARNSDRIGRLNRSRGACLDTDIDHAACGVLYGDRDRIVPDIHLGRRAAQARHRHQTAFEGFWISQQVGQGDHQRCRLGSGAQVDHRAGIRRIDLRQATENQDRTHNNIAVSPDQSGHLGKIEYIDAKVAVLEVATEFHGVEVFLGADCFHGHGFTQIQRDAPGIHVPEICYGNSHPYRRGNANWR